MLIIGTLSACEKTIWDGVVMAEVDELTGKQTGLFRTYGPTQNLVIENETVPVTIGYWCRIVNTYDNLPLMVEDQLFFRISLPDTSSITSTHPAFSSGFARVAVDGNELWGFAFDNDDIVESGDWYLYGLVDTFEPHFANLRGDMGTKYGVTLLAALHIKNNPRYSDEQAGRIAGRILASDVWHPYFDPANVVGRQFDVSKLSNKWSTTKDYVASSYAPHDTLAIDLGSVLRFPLRGFDQAMNSVRSQCPVNTSIGAWNTVRDSVFAFAECVDDMNREAGQEESSSCNVPSILSPSRP